jgi:hypothetical protein
VQGRALCCGPAYARPRWATKQAAKHDTRALASCLHESCRVVGWPGYIRLRRTARETDDGLQKGPGEARRRVFLNLTVYPKREDPPVDFRIRRESGIRAGKVGNNLEKRLCLKDKNAGVSCCTKDLGWD